MSGLQQYSSLPLRTLKPGLVTLTQQHLAYNHTDVDGVTYYEANIWSTYMLVRAGKVLNIIEEKFGVAGEELARTIMSEGHVTLTELSEAYGLREDDVDDEHPYTNGNSHSNGTNGQHYDRHRGDRQIRSHNQLRRLLQQMKRAGYVIAVTRKSFMSPADADIEAASRARGGLPATKAPNGKKQREELSKATNSLKRRWRDREVESDVSEDEDDGPPAKKIKNGNLSNGVNGAAAPCYDSAHDVSDEVPAYRCAC